MRRLIDDEREQLIQAIARREGNARELAKWFDIKPDELRGFVRANREEIETVANNERASWQRVSTEDTAETLTPTQLDDLWITNKFERLKRLQELAELAYKDAHHGNLAGSDLATALREFRSYLTLAANELGQLLHRGSGESSGADDLSATVMGVDLESLK